MKTSDDLSKLIKTLSQAEKRYFKRFASLHVKGEMNNYVKLFEAIEKQKEYDESEIKERLKNEKFVSQLSVLKNYLYNLILKSLSAYRAQKSAVSRLNEHIQAVEILYKKSLFDQAEKILNRAKQTAEKYQKYTHLIEIFRWRQKLISRKQYYDNMEKDYDEIFNNESYALKVLENLNKFSKIAGQTLTINKKKIVLRTSEDEDKLRKILNDPLLSSEEKALSYDARTMFYFVNIINSYKLDDLAAASDYMKKRITFIESHPELLKEDFETYIRAIIDGLVVQKNLKKYDEAENTIIKIRTLPQIYPENIDENIELLIFFSSYYIELSVCIDGGFFEKGLLLARTIESELKRLGLKLGVFRQTTFCFQLARLYFITGNYDKAISSLNNILNNSYPAILEELQCLSRLLNLIIHFELLDYDLIEYNLKSTYRFLSKKKQLYDVEKTILQFLRKTFKVKTNKQLLSLFKDLREQLIVLSRNALDRRLIEELCLISWLESKIDRRKLEDVLREKILQTEINTQA